MEWLVWLIVAVVVAPFALVLLGMVLPRGGKLPAGMAPPRKLS
ncbi:hypothetical protein [Azospirillum argentinense]|nr:hypothetical protein [Azospirillum argentinense]